MACTLSECQQTEAWRTMFHLLLTTCFASILCYASAPDVGYTSAERCLQQGAILSGLARAQMNFPRMEQTSRIVCSGIDGSTETVYVGSSGLQLTHFPEDASSLPDID
jgi:hypothetical protein